MAVTKRPIKALCHPTKTLKLKTSHPASVTAKDETNVTAQAKKPPQLKSQ
ncbi:MAG: hypothetical protein ACQZ2J_28320 [Pseudomonas piscis]